MAVDDGGQHEEILDRIQLLTNKLVNFCENADLVGRSSSGDKSRSSTVCLDINCPCDGRHPVLCTGEANSKKITVSAGIGVKHLCQLWYIFELIQQLLTTGRTATQRELYYRSLGSSGTQQQQLFPSQTRLNARLVEAVDLLQTERHKVGILSTAKGLLAGPRDTIFHGRDGPASALLHLNTEAADQGITITESLVANCTSFNSTARHVIVVEKDTVFQRILSQGGRHLLLGRLPCFIITARGYPDYRTIRFLSLLHDVADKQGTQRLPMWYLGDLDPHGLSIYLAYRRRLPELKWLGLSHKDIEEYNIPVEACGIQMTACDETLLRRLSANIESLPGVLADEVAYLNTSRRKFEIECMYCKGLDFLSESYLITKILADPPPHKSS
ncbi:hypothetical protein FOZ62_028155 [Perkinsus olseni]|uniref:DNA topoisomerase (ATP-hydrolyzing) n=2 Tax=Perkinsus olseni TaxID=32597 RepID=A0A7J6N6S6_PEROL|nr:hypothetical protein FOZ62_028155 [Perkinsus olseni]